MPNRARPRLQPVIVGRSNRLTNTSRTTAPNTETHTHHHTPRAGRVNEVNARVVTTARPGSTSTENAAARNLHGAKAFSGRSWAASVVWCLIDHHRHFVTWSSFEIL